MDRRSRRWLRRIAGLVLAAAVVAGLPAPMPEALGAAPVETELETVRVGRGDNLSALLSRAGVSAVDADRIARAIQRKTNLRRMRVGREVRLLFGVDGGRRAIPLAVSVETRPGRFVEAVRTADGRYRAHRTTLPLARPVPLAEVAFERDGRAVTVRRNETIGGILRRHGIDGKIVDAVVEALRANFDPRDLMPGHAVSLVAGRAADGAPLLQGIALYLDDDRAVAVVRTEDGGFAARRTTGAALREAGLAHAVAATPRKPALETAQARPSSAEQPPAAAPINETRQNTEAPDLLELRRILHAGNTLMDLLLDADVRRSEADALVQSLRRVHNPRRLPAGIAVRIVKQAKPDFEPRIAQLEIELPRGRYIQVERGKKGRFSSRMTKRALQPVLAAKQSAPAAARAAARKLDILPPAAKRVTVRSGDTLMAILRRHGIDRVEADRAIQEARRLVNLRRLGIGQEVTLVTGIDETGADTLEVVALRTGDDRFVTVTRAGSGRFEAARVDRLALTEAPLQRLAASADGAPADGEPPPIRMKQATLDGRGEVMNGAFVAAAAPVADAAPQPAADTAAILAAAHDDNEDGLVRRAVVLRKGDTLSDALTRAGGTREEAEAAIAAFRDVYNPRRLRVGQTLSLSFDAANGSNGAPQLASFVLDVAPDRDVVVARGNDGIFLPSVVDRPLDRVLQRAVGAVHSSLYDAAAEAEIPNQIFMEMVHIFSYDVDFQRDVQPGNRFEVLYEAAYDMAGDFVENGPILYARLEAGERMIELFRYKPEEGPTDHLDAHGQSVRKALLRTPINGARLSSGYGMRKHPILGYNKKHLGLDFAAPKGTPIFAAGDGTITMIGRHGNYGKYVRIRHNGTYSTSYAHLNGYAKGMKRGKRVRQGQVIGYVGSTGMSTGPHLHYEVMRDGKRINPMTLKLPTGRKLEGRERAAFQQQVQKITILLAEVPALTRVAQR